MNEAEATATRARARRPLLVTGSHRSGTTWVGQVLAGTGAYAYVHEPFNASLFPRLTHIRLGGHYTYVTEANETAYLESVTDVLAHRFPFREQVREVRTPQQAAKLVREWGRSTARRLGGRPALVKDPIALFAAEWMAQRFDVDVLVMVRHPAAFVSSIKRLGWEFDFEYWTRQPLLLRDELPALAGEIEAAARERPDRIGQAILLWRAIHTVIARLADEHPEWLVVRHE
ncbi:MAG TPA: sulfotransferase, partial [Acidimicrobiia bacterium]|nr:sulfotransferase [Acidimicrobiia bacterium]